MSERWWAPGGSTDLLTPGTDAKADLGLFLLAAHRAGAEALVEVSKGAIPSELGIIMALAETRAEIGPQLVDAVSAHLEPTYAGVLVCDVLDAGDRGAVDVYRAMVAKGVSPPVALERASHAYGMPMRQMGGFTHLATDPKANPRAVADAADRALMSYVSKMADAEAPAVAEVVKAELSVAERTDFDRLHPRDATGQFTETPDAPAKPAMSTLDRIRMRLGLSSPEPTRVAEVTREPAKPERVQRTQRKQRTQRAKPQLVATATAAPTHANAAHAAVVNAQEIAVVVNAGAAQAKAPKGGRPPVIPELLEELPPGDGPYYDIGQSIVIGVPLDASRALRDTAADQAMTQKKTGRRIFRMGYLTQQAHYVEQFGTNQKGAHASKAGDTVQQHADTWVEPKVSTIPLEELRGNREEMQAYLERKRTLAASRKRIMPDGSERLVLDEEELPFVKVLPVYRPYSPTGSFEANDWVVVHYQESDVGERAIPAVDEFVIEYDARGNLQGETGTRRGKTHVDVELDPNAVYEIIHAPHKSTARGSLIRAEQYYDKVNHVEVNRWYLRPLGEGEVEDVIEGIEKALDVLEARTFEQLHPRDAEGQFTEVASRPTLISPAERPTRRTQRTQRSQRHQRRQPVEPVVTAPVRTAHAGPVTARAAKSSPMHAALASPVSRKKKLRDVPILGDDKNYRVFAEDEFQEVFEGIGREAFSAMHTKNVPVVLTGDNKKTLHRMGEIKVKHIPEAMALNLGQEISRQQVSRDTLAVIKHHSRGGVPDWEHVAERVQALLDTHPEYDLVEMERDEAEHAIVVYGAMVSGGFQNVVEFDTHLDWTQPVEIRFLGEFRARDALAESNDTVTNLVGELENLDAYEDDPSKTSVANPMIHRYQVTSPPVRRYRADTR